MAFRPGAKLRKKPPAARLVDPVVPPPRGRQEPQRFMVNVLLRRTILGLESHPDRVGSPDDDRPRFPAMAGNCAFERTRRGGGRSGARLFVSDLTADELAPAEGLMLKLLDDPSPLVRRSLADALAPSPAAPAPVIIALASDQPQIAAPIYALSPLLIDADLVDGVATGGDAVQAAIASRAVLPAAAALAELRPLIRHLCASGQLTAGL